VSSPGYDDCIRRIGLIALAALVIAAIALTGCGARSAQPAVLAPPLVPAVKAAEPVLLYVGAGTSPTDVSAIEGILKSLNIGYLTADQNQLNAMTEPELGGYTLLIVPGGNSITIGGNLSGNTTTTVHNAVAQYGLHYLGICAGAFFGGYSIYNGLDLTSGVYFNFYNAEFQGIHVEPVEIALASGSPLDVYWNDGPQLSGWGDVVAKYPDGTPAIAEGTSGNGFVLLTGVHFEAPASWRGNLPFTTPLSVDVGYAGTLIQAALSGTSLPHF
jgi:glutamine amidotransferase-like uncharacterized protein